MDQLSKVTIHMVTSLDGFIAKKDGDVSWLHSTDNYEKGHVLTEGAIENFVKGIDCYVIGSHTYEHALELGWPYGEKPVIVLTSRTLTSARANVVFHKGDLKQLFQQQLSPKYRNIWVGGGAKLTKSLLQVQLADELIVSIMPIILGDGLLFFNYIGLEQRLHLKDVVAYKDGMVEMTYEIIK